MAVSLVRPPWPSIVSTDRFQIDKIRGCLVVPLCLHELAVPAVVRSAPGSVKQHYFPLFVLFLLSIRVSVSTCDGR
jgi:hypothetical protein